MTDIPFKFDDLVSFNQLSLLNVFDLKEGEVCSSYEPIQSVVVSNKHGFTIFSCPQYLKYASTQNIMGASGSCLNKQVESDVDNCLSFTLPESTLISKVGLNASELLLAVLYSQGDMQVLRLFDVRSFTMNGDDMEKVFDNDFLAEKILSQSHPQKMVIDFIWSPLSHDLFAILFNDGKCQLLEVKSHKRAIHIKKNLNSSNDDFVKSIFWDVNALFIIQQSLGESYAILAQDKDGNSLRKYPFDEASSKTLKDRVILKSYFISSPRFAILFVVSEGGSDDGVEVMQVGFKEDAEGFASSITYLSPFYSVGSDRRREIWLHYIPSRSLLIAAFSQAPDACVICIGEDANSTQLISLLDLPEIGQITVPMFNYNESFVIGMDVDYTYCITDNSDNDKSAHTTFSPTLIISTSSGRAVIFSISFTNHQKEERDLQRYIQNFPPFDQEILDKEENGDFKGEEIIDSDKSTTKEATQTKLSSHLNLTSKRVPCIKETAFHNVYNIFRDEVHKSMEVFKEKLNLATYYDQVYSINAISKRLERVLGNTAMSEKKILLASENFIKVFALLDETRNFLSINGSQFKDENALLTSKLQKLEGESESLLKRIKEAFHQVKQRHEHLFIAQNENCSTECYPTMKKTSPIEMFTNCLKNNEIRMKKVGLSVSKLEQKFESLTLDSLPPYLNGVNEQAPIGKEELSLDSTPQPNSLMFKNERMERLRDYFLNDFVFIYSHCDSINDISLRQIDSNEEKEDQNDAINKIDNFLDRNYNKLDSFSADLFSKFTKADAMISKDSIANSMNDHRYQDSTSQNVKLFDVKDIKTREVKLFTLKLKEEDIKFSPPATSKMSNIPLSGSTSTAQSSKSVENGDVKKDANLASMSNVAVNSSAGESSFTTVSSFNNATLLKISTSNDFQFDFSASLQKSLPNFAVVSKKEDLSPDLRTSVVLTTIPAYTSSTTLCEEKKSDSLKFSFSTIPNQEDKQTTAAPGSLGFSFLTSSISPTPIVASANDNTLSSVFITNPPASSQVFSAFSSQQGNIFAKPSSQFSFLNSASSVPSAFSNPTSTSSAPSQFSLPSSNSPFSFTSQLFNTASTANQQSGPPSQFSAFAIKSPLTSDKIETVKNFSFFPQSNSPFGQVVTSSTPASSQFSFLSANSFPSASQMGITPAFNSSPFSNVAQTTPISPFGQVVSVSPAAQGFTFGATATFGSPTSQLTNNSFSSNLAPFSDSSPTFATTKTFGSCSNTQQMSGFAELAAAQNPFSPGLNFAHQTNAPQQAFKNPFHGSSFQTYRS